MHEAAHDDRDATDDDIHRQLIAQAQAIEALQRELAAQAQATDALRRELADVRRVEPPPMPSRLLAPAATSATEPGRRDGARESGMSRRGLLLGGVGAAAAGAVAAVASASPAAANGQGGSLTLGDPTNAATNTTGVTGNFSDRAVLQVNNSGSASAVYGKIGTASGLAGTAAVLGDSTGAVGTMGISATRNGVEGTTTARTAAGVKGTGAAVGVLGVGPTPSTLEMPDCGVAGSSSGSYGVAGLSDTNIGVSGQSSSGSGVLGQTDTGFGVVGRHGGSSGLLALGPLPAAILADSNLAEGVVGMSGAKSGVHGISGYGANRGTVAGVFGESDANPGVFGMSNTGDGLVGYCASGYGVRATSGGIAGRFDSDAGQLWLNPFQNVRPSPRTDTVGHGRGEILRDSDGDLWYCATAGVPGVWRKLAGPSTAGAFHALPTPVRVYDSRFGTAPTTVGPKSVLSANVARTLDLKVNASTVPAGATAAMVTILLFDTVAGAGNFAIWAASAPTPLSRALVWGGTDARFSTLALTALDLTAKCQVLSSLQTNVALDVVGYYL